jgi:putative restriction endonuclease
MFNEGKHMNRTLHFYNYEQCYAHYIKRIMSIRQAKIHGEVIVAKPVLILALIDGVESGEFTVNRFTLNEWLEKRYLVLMKQYTRNSQFPNPADISNPFWHLQGDGFWHLIHKTAVPEGTTPTKKWLKENVTYGHFDDDMWVLLQNKVWRQKLRDYIVEHKLTDDSWLGKIAAEGLGAIAALLLVA